MAEIKAKVGADIDVPPKRLQVLFLGKCVHDNVTVDALGVGRNDVVQCMVVLA